MKPNAFAARCFGHEESCVYKALGWTALTLRVNEGLILQKKSPEEAKQKNHGNHRKTLHRQHETQMGALQYEGARKVKAAVIKRALVVVSWPT